MIKRRGDNRRKTKAKQAILKNAGMNLVTNVLETGHG
jgi:hypothetical protein